MSFLECFQIITFLHYFFVTTSAVFLPPFLFFFLKYSPKIGVRIIQGCALYMGKYGISYVIQVIIMISSEIQVNHHILI